MCWLENVTGFFFLLPAIKVTYPVGVDITEAAISFSIVMRTVCCYYNCLNEKFCTCLTGLYLPCPAELLAFGADDTQDKQTK